MPNSRRRRANIAQLGKVGRHWTRGRLIREIRARRALGRPIKVASVRTEGRNDLTHAAAALLGSWDRALGLAGIHAENVRAKRRWTKEKVLFEIRKLGRWVSSQRKDCKALVHAALNHFGSWRRAYLAAGVPYTPWRYSREYILNIIRTRAERRLPLTLGGLLRKDHPGIQAASIREFGSWRSALEAGGCGEMPRNGTLPRVEKRWTRDEVVGEFVKLRKERKAVTADLLRRHRRPGYVSLRTAVEQIFGRISLAKRAAGFQVAAQIIVSGSSAKCQITSGGL